MSTTLKELDIVFVSVMNDDDVILTTHVFDNSMPYDEVVEFITKNYNLEGEFKIFVER